ncbi:efflux RND transporter periplasmic adaptor subunit [Legionella yabuuchiae]|uniref:efflux RND transporter periplasmic adaptor subunit n=1 Tax=Legionella yabuuchiae TaxID=376727 RepID=UPI0010552B6F|nr:efflux RND transporter periplasmic adaptor subunit [Legionella yabuuchiae]
MKNTKLKKRLTIMIIALVIVFGGIIGYNLFKSYMMKRYFATYEAPAVTVSSVVAKQENWKPTISAVGNFVAVNGVDVNSEAAGKVVAIHFESGEYVQKDAPLIDIDDSVDQATLKFNQSELALQKINYQRQVDLFKRGATPVSNVDAAKAKLLQAEADVEKTEAIIRQKHITAPFAGQLGIRQINLGQFISPGETKTVTLQSMDPLYLEFYLPEQLLKKLHVNQEITFSVEENPNLLFKGKITAINAKVDVNTHNVLVQATVPNCPADALKNPEKSPLVKIIKSEFNQKLIVICSPEVNKKNKIDKFNFIPGMFAAIEVNQPALKDVVVLPTTSISYSLYGDAVYVIEQDKEGKKDKDGKDILHVKRVFITTGDQQGNYTVIEKGVNAGQKVVGSGDLKLDDGTRVIINNDIQLTDTADPKTLGE